MNAYWCSDAVLPRLLGGYVEDLEFNLFFGRRSRTTQEIRSFRVLEFHRFRIIYWFIQRLALKSKNIPYNLEK